MKAMHNIITAIMMVCAIEVNGMTMPDTTEVAQPDSVAMAYSLGEVEVRAKGSYAVPQGVAYVPSKLSKKTSGDVYSLISHMGIGQLWVNENEIKSLTNESVSVYIDGKKATTDDMLTLIPADVQRVEVLRSPLDAKYQNDQLVVNVVTRKISYGGYVVASANQQFISDSGHYSLLGKFVKGKSTLQAAAKYYYISNKNDHGLTRERYGQDGDGGGVIERLSEWTIDKGLSKNWEAKLTWLYEGDATWYVKAYGGAGFQENPLAKHGVRTGEIAYSQTADDNSVTPYVRAEFMKKFARGSMLLAQTGLTMSINDRKWGYMADDGDGGNVFTKSHETVYSPYVYVRYTHPIRTNSSVGVHLYGDNKMYAVDYDGSTDRTLKTNEGLYQLSADYKHTFDFNGKQAWLKGLVIAPVRIIKQGDAAASTSLNVATWLTAGYSDNEGVSMFFNAMFRRNERPISSMNDVMIKDTDITGHVGNRSTRNPLTYALQLDCNWMLNDMIDLSAYISYSHEMRSVITDYENIDGVVYSYLRNSGVHSRLDPMVTASLNLLNRSLIMQGTVSVVNEHHSGMLKFDYWGVCPMFVMTYMMKNGFSATLQYMYPLTKQYNSMASTIQHYNDHVLYVKASYVYRNLSVGLSVNPLYKWIKTEAETRIGCADIYNERYLRGGARRVGVDVRYVFDFGRKYPHIDNETLDTKPITSQ